MLDGILIHKWPFISGTDWYSVTNKRHATQDARGVVDHTLPNGLGLFVQFAAPSWRHYFSAHANFVRTPAPKIPKNSARTVPHMYITRTVVHPLFNIFPAACDPAVPCTQGQGTTVKHAMHNHFPGGCDGQSRVPHPTHVLGRSVGWSVNSVFSSSPFVYPDAVADGPERPRMLRCMRGGSLLLLRQHIPLSAQVRRARSVLSGGIVSTVASSGGVLRRTCRT